MPRIINAQFSEKEFKTIMKAKDLTGKTWHDWILWLAKLSLVKNQIIENERKG